jgi:hypothetical protein
MANLERVVAKIEELKNRTGASVNGAVVEALVMEIQEVEREWEQRLAQLAAKVDEAYARADVARPASVVESAPSTAQAQGEPPRQRRRDR